MPAASVSACTCCECAHSWPRRQVQQLVAGRLQAETRAAEMTSRVEELSAEREELCQRLQLPQHELSQDQTGDGQR